MLECVWQMDNATLKSKHKYGEIVTQYTERERESQVQARGRRKLAFDYLRPKSFGIVRPIRTSIIIHVKFSAQIHGMNL